MNGSNGNSIAPAANASAVTPAQLQAKFDLGISLTLHNWQALSIAVDNEWGGTDSQDKRDWFAGAISDLFTSNPETDEQDLEDMLLQVLEDEFELALDDGSEAIVAAAIMRVKRQVEDRDFASIDAAWDTFSQRQRTKTVAKAVRAGPGSDDEDDSVDDEEQGSGEDEDEVMGDAPQLVEGKRAPKAKVEPEVDEDGFTTVVSRRR